MQLPARTAFACSVAQSGSPSWLKRRYTEKQVAKSPGSTRWKGRMILPRRLGLWLSLLVATRVAIVAAADAFAYDHNADFAIEKKSTQARDGATVRDISFVAVPGRDDGRIDAFLVTPPAGGAGAQAGILWVHWLGDPATSNRTQFLDEAV